MAMVDFMKHQQVKPCPRMMVSRWSSLLQIIPNEAWLLRDTALLKVTQDLVWEELLVKSVL